MKNIMKSQIYQLKKSRLAYVIFFIVLLLNVFSVFANVINNLEGEAITGSSYTADVGASVLYIPLFYISIITGIVSGYDFMDKTTNYEIMTGHSRREVYFGRAIPSILISIMGGMILAVIPSVIVGVIFGWGTKMKLSGVIVRYMLVIFPYFRVACELIFLTFIVRNSYIIMATGYIYILFGEMLPNIVKDSSNVFLGLTNLNLLGHFESFSTYSILNGADAIIVYDSSIDTASIVSTIAASLCIGGFFLMLGYVFFKNDDLS